MLITFKSRNKILLAFKKNHASTPIKLFPVQPEVTTDLIYVIILPLWFWLCIFLISSSEKYSLGSFWTLLDFCHAGCIILYLIYYNIMFIIIIHAILCSSSKFFSVVKMCQNLFIHFTVSTLVIFPVGYY